MRYFVAKDVMNTRFISVPADWSVEEVAQFFVDKAITGAPVTDEDGKFIGVVSLTDIVRHSSFAEMNMRADEPHDYYLHGWEDRLAPEEIASFHVAEKPQAFVHNIMTPMIFKVEASTPIQEVAEAMMGGRIHRLMVTRNDKIVGMISTMDMLKVIRDL